MTTKLWLLIILKFLVKDLIDCKSTNKTAKNKVRLKAGKVSKRIIVKLRQYVATAEGSENIKEKKLTNPDLLKSDKSILKAGTSPARDPMNMTEKIITFLKTKRRSSL